MNIQELPSNYTHPMGVTGYHWGLFEGEELVVASVTEDEIQLILNGVIEESKKA